MAGDRAGEGNRTLTASLEGWGSTIELRPRLINADWNARSLSAATVQIRSVSRGRQASFRCQVGWPVSNFPVGEAGFEPAKAEPPDLQSGPFGHSGIPPCNLSDWSRLCRNAVARFVRAVALKQQTRQKWQTGVSRSLLTKRGQTSWPLSVASRGHITVSDLINDVFSDLDYR